MEKPAPGRGDVGLTKRARIGVILTLSALALFGGFLFINANLRPVLEGLSGARVQAVAAKAMNNAILDVIAEGYTYDTLIHVRTTESRVYLLQADSARLNMLAADCANAAQVRISEMGEQGVSIPLGTISGIPLFAGKGPREQRDLTRAMPMTTGVIDAVTPYRLFRDRGYQGPVLAEPINPIYEDFRKMPAEEVVKIIAECYDRMEALADGR